MTSPTLMTPEALAEARALCDAQKPLTVIDDKATASVCISDGDTYIARSSYVWAGDAALHREALARVGRIVGLVNAVPALLAHTEAVERENVTLRARIERQAEWLRWPAYASQKERAELREQLDTACARIVELEQMLTGSGAVVNMEEANG